MRLVISNDVSDIDLIFLYRNGFPEAFDVLYRRHWKWVFHFCLRRVRNYHIAEELTQETFLKIHLNLHRVRNPAAFGSWVFSIAHRVTLQNQEKNHQGFSEQSIEDMQEYYSGVYGTANDVVFMMTGLVSYPQNDDELSSVMKILGRLPDRRRLAFSLAILQEFSYKETAELLGTSLPAVKAAVFKARKELRTHFFRGHKRRTSAKTAVPA